MVRRAHILVRGLLFEAAIQEVDDHFGKKARRRSVLSFSDA